MSGIDLIAAERQRQIEAEGWTPKHDDEYCNGELAEAAACYAHPNRPMVPDTNGIDPPVPCDWPWDPEWWKPKDRVRDLVRAGALIAAEIDRLQREDARRETPHGE